jgi:hypothetical protein
MDTTQKSSMLYFFLSKYTENLIMRTYCNYIQKNDYYGINQEKSEIE